MRRSTNERNGPSYPPGARSGSPEEYHAYHDSDGSATLSTTVVHALADCMGIDVTDGSISLYDSIDPDALDSIFRPQYDGTPRASGWVTFFVSDYRVTVHGDGHIFIDPPRESW